MVCPDFRRGLGYETISRFRAKTLRQKRDQDNQTPDAQSERFSILFWMDPRLQSGLDQLARDLKRNPGRRLVRPPGARGVMIRRSFFLTNSFGDANLTGLDSSSLPAQGGGIMEYAGDQS